MIGPSSSHTAGAVRIGLAARHLLGDVPRFASVGLHGSFAATGKGHATDRGIVAGLLGWPPDDARLKNSLAAAQKERLRVEFANVDLGDSIHPNSALIRLADDEGRELNITASSIGGGNIEVVSVDGFAVRFSGSLNTLVIWHEDRPGFLAHVTAILACVDANIATIQTARRHRAENALTLIELDGVPQPEATALLRRIGHVRRLACVPPLP